MKDQDLIPAEQGPFRVVLLFGPPGSGKGTMGKFLSSAGNHFHLSSGDIFRGLAPESPAGKLFHTYAGKGHLVPDEVTIQIWRHYVSGLIATNRYFPHQQLLLLDGIPRTPHQVDLLAPYVDVVQVVMLEMPDLEKLLQRMRRRALIERRADDLDEGVLRTRMQVYERETAKLISKYEEARISRFNADQKPLEVLRDILVRLSSVL